MFVSNIKILSYTLLKVVYNIYSSLENLNLKNNNNNYLQIYILLYGFWKNKNETMVLVFKYPQWIWRGLENFVS
jgi:hypothetical protein